MAVLVQPILIGVVSVLLWIASICPALAENKWGVGSDLGFTSGTVNGTVFTLGFNLDYYVDRNFSFGPMMLLSPAGDLFQIAVEESASITCVSKTELTWYRSLASASCTPVSTGAKGRLASIGTTQVGTFRSGSHLNIRCCIISLSPQPCW